MVDELITIVVPIYNVEKYLQRCINSIVNQTYTRLEIILVDDGSPDSCPQICDEWAKRDDRIKVIHKENEGLGFARNTGIENASGKYICFFDSDDYVALNAIEKAYNRIRDEQADVALFGYNSVDCNGKIVESRVANPPKDVYEGREVQNEFLVNLISRNPDTHADWQLQMSACMALFSLKQIRINNCKFASERQIISEDVFFLLGFYKYVQKIVVLKEALYYYCENPTSLTRTYREDRFEKIKYFYDSCIVLCEECGFSEQVKKQLSGPYISFIIAAMKMLVNSDMIFLKKKKIMQNIIEDEHFQRVLKQVNMQCERGTRKVLFSAIKRKRINIVYLLVKAKT